jgi:hypothetical protein
MKYIIMKDTRAIERPTASWAYSGPACTRAEVEPGKVYDSEDEAKRDADALTECNPVGFVVLAIDG